jgi:hypothetical protein
MTLIPLLPPLLLLLAASPSTVGAQRLDGAWRKNLNKTAGDCVHSGLTCLNGGYYDADACMPYVPCRQTGSQGWDMAGLWLARTCHRLMLQSKQQLMIASINQLTPGGMQQP